MAKGYCVECDAALSLGKSPYKGQKVTCFKCGAALEVVNLSPIELDLIFDDDLDELEDYDPDSDIDSDFDYDYDSDSQIEEY
jgi:lysine biosynthesis protein LysW